MKMFTCKFSQDEVTHQTLRVGSKKPVQQGRAWFSVSRRGPPLFYARSVCVIREHGKMATCLREGAPAKAGNAAGGFFQQTLKEMPWSKEAYLGTGHPLTMPTGPSRY
jgi:hypothetical protein